MFRTHRTFAWACLACALGLLFLLTACSGGGSSNPAQSNQWDQMKRDQGKWG